VVSNILWGLGDTEKKLSKTKHKNNKVIKERWKKTESKPD